MLVFAFYRVNVDIRGRRQDLDVREVHRRLCAEEFNVQRALLSDLSQRCLFWVFSWFDVTSEGQPAIKCTMMNKEYLFSEHDKDRHCEIKIIK
jgi:hypothetical protein